MNAIHISGLKPSSVQSAMLQQIQQELSSVDKEGLVGLLGKQVEVKMLENLDNGRSLVELNGSRLVAEGGSSLSPGDIQLAEVISVSPEVVIRLLNTPENLSPLLRESVGLLLEKPNVFADRLGELGLLLQEFEGSVPAALQETLQNFSSDTLLGKLGMELLRLPEYLGLLTEQQLAALDSRRNPLLSRDMSWILGRNLKSELLKAENWLASQPQHEAADKLGMVIHDLLSLVTLNQVYNNPGVKQYDGLFLIFPLFLADNELDVWMKMRQHENDAQGEDRDSLQTVSFYLDFPDFGRVGTRVVMMHKEAIISIQVEGEVQQALLQEQVPEVQSRLSGLLARRVAIKVEKVSESRLLEFWQENFLDELPGLVDIEA